MNSDPKHTAREDGTDAAAGLARLNEMVAPDAKAALMGCCGSVRWAAEMAHRRPFGGLDAILNAADEVWFGLTRADWLDAFSHHPRIGETNLAQAKFVKTAEQSGNEQSGMADASDEIRREFAAGNAEYERKFGHVFLICASGKSGVFMLEQVRARMRNDAATELAKAAKEQSMIVRMRLTKLVNG